MSEKKLVSVIIPVYNVEKYLRCCLDSMTTQTLKEIEIICINDCSSDNSAGILEEYAASDSRVRIINHTENTGQGGARNTGIKAAQADYIVMPDSDDWAEPEYVENLYQTAVKTGADVVQCAFRSFNEATKRYKDCHKGRYREVEKRANEERLFSIFFNTSPWNKLYRRTLFEDNGIEFPNHLYYQDLAIIYQIEFGAKKIVTLPCPLYNYRIRGESVTTTSSTKHIEDYFKVFAMIWSFLQQQNLTDKRQVLGRYTNLINHHIFGRCLKHFVFTGDAETQKCYIQQFFQCLGTFYEETGLHKIDILTNKDQVALALTVNRGARFMLCSPKEKAKGLLAYPFKKLLHR